MPTAGRAWPPARGVLFAGRSFGPFTAYSQCPKRQLGAHVDADGAKTEPSSISALEHVARMMPLPVTRPPARVR